MKRRNYSEEQLESMLKNLPPIEDHQSKDDLYRSITPEVSKQKRKMAPWVLPGIATAAVVLLLAVMVPMFMSSNQFSETADHGESSGKAANESKDFSTSSQKESAILQKDGQRSSNEESAATSEESLPDAATNSSPSVPANNITPYTVHELDSRMEKTVLTGKQGQVVVPLTLVPQDSQNSSDIMKAIQPESMGLVGSVISDLSFKVNKENQTATVIFPNEFSISGETWAQMIMESIRWRLEGNDLQSIHLETESGSPVILGAYGQMEKISPIAEGEYIYQLYQHSGNDQQFLVPVKTDGKLSIEEALSKMKKGILQTASVHPAVPEHVNFTSLEPGGDRLTLEVDHGAWANEQQLLNMIEATMMTAKQFGYSQVRFKNIEMEEFPYYDLQQPIELPDSINPITVQP